MDDGAVNRSAPILVLGAGGQVGRALVRLLGERALGWDRSQCDLADLTSLPVRLDKALATGRPAAVINAAAYTAVDRAESETAAATVEESRATGMTN